MARMPLLLFVAAAGGFAAIHWIGTGPGGAFVAMAWGIGALRIFGLHLPPGLAVALLPMVMRSPTLNYPFAVILGTSILVLWATAYRRWIPGSVLIRKLTAVSERRVTTVSAAGTNAPPSRQP
jgi:CBS-domain-containing membrane protein